MLCFSLEQTAQKVDFEKMTIKNPEKLHKKTPLFNKDLQYRKIKVPESL